MATTGELLKDYRRKRDFSKTAEPSGAKPVEAKASRLRFVVQKHDATRLHYDFRLELDGVLKSWAVTKGPSTDPADKRLAVRVEDHPLDYGSFEGTIPESEYGGGTVMLWDEGTWEPLGDPHEGLESGDLKFRLSGKRMKGEWVLVHMKGRDQQTKAGPRENWLLIKHRDDKATEGGEGLVEKFTNSVSTGRDLDGIAKGLKSKRRAAKPASAEKSKVKPAATASARAVAFTDEAGIAAAARFGIELTHPERIVYPGQGVTKGEVAAYYEAVAERMLPHLANRPLSLVRCPQGRSKYCFFQKHDTGGFPGATHKMPVTEKDGTKENYLYVDDLAGILGAVQMNTLEFHVWGSRVDDLERPDRIIFDIDPDEGLAFAEVRQAALDLRDRLATLGLETFPMVTGGKGIHVIAPLTPAAEWPEVKTFCKGVAHLLEDEEPERFVANMSKAKRKGRMFIDYLRNERGATAVAPFSTRSREGAPCAVPVGWDEVPSLDGANGFSLGAAAARAAGPDPWKGYFAIRQKITAAMVKAVGG